MKKLLLFILLTTLLSCGNGDISSKIAQLESDHAETPTTEIKKQLLASYKSYLNDLKEDTNGFSEISKKAATLEVDLNQYQNAVATLTKAVKNYSSGTSYAANLGLLSSITTNQIHGGKIEAAANDFKNLFPNAANLKTTFNPIMKNLAATMLDEKTAQWDREKVRDYVSMAKIQAAIVTKDDEVQKSLFDAANMNIALKKFDDALAIYDYVLANADNFSKAPSALFLKGFTYDEHLKNYDEARKIYNDFLEKYPEDGYAESVKASLKNLGKTAEEIIQSFESK